MCGKLIKELATKLLGREVASMVWGRMEVIGDIALIRKPPQTPLDVLKPIAEEIINKYPYIKSVWASTSPVTGIHRIRDYAYLAGEHRSTTVYKEHGCLFYVDITKVYISPVLSYEHLRVARDVMDGEFVINMFAGIGLFSIVVAKHAKPSKVVSIDVNPHAYEFMVKNIKANNVEDVVEPILGDASVVINNYIAIADRVLMPLPELAFNYFNYAVNSIKESGIIHVYEFGRGLNRKSVIDSLVSKYLRRCSELGVSAEVMVSRVVRSVGPRTYQVVIDLKVSK